MYLQLQQHMDTGLANRPFAKNDEKDIMEKRSAGAVWALVAFGATFLQFFWFWVNLGSEIVFPNAQNHLRQNMIWSHLFSPEFTRLHLEKKTRTSDFVAGARMEPSIHRKVHVLILSPCRVLHNYKPNSLCTSDKRTARSQTLLHNNLQKPTKRR